MVATLQTNKLLFFRSANGIEIVTHQTNSGVHCIRPTLTEYNPIQPFRRQCCQSCSKLNGRFAGKMKVPCRIGQLFKLLFGSLYNGLLTVTGVDAPQPGEGVLNSLTVNIGKVNTLC